MSEVEQNVIDTFGGKVVDIKDVNMQKEKEPAVEEQAVDNGNNSNNNTQTTEDQELAAEYDIKEITIKKTTNDPIEPTDFIINGFEAGTVGLLTGASGTGKSFFALQLCFALADSTKRINFLDLCNEKRGKVAYITAEDSDNILKYRIKTIGQYLMHTVNADILDAIDENMKAYSLQGKMVAIFSKRYDANSTNTVNKWQNFFLKISKNKRLIVIDTLRKFHLADENDSSEMSEVIGFFQYIAKLNNCSILITHHTSKAGSTGEMNDEQTAVRGSGAIVDNVRYQMAIARMSKYQTTKHGIDEQNRSFYIQTDFPKLNYTQPINKKWLKRLENGVLEEIDLAESKGGKNGSKRFK